MPNRIIKESICTSENINDLTPAVDNIEITLNHVKSRYNKLAPNPVQSNPIRIECSTQPAAQSGTLPERDVRAAIVDFGKRLGSKMAALKPSPNGNDDDAPADYDIPFDDGDEMHDEDEDENGNGDSDGLVSKHVVPFDADIKFSQTDVDVDTKNEKTTFNLEEVIKSLEEYDRILKGNNKPRDRTESSNYSFNDNSE